MNNNLPLISIVITSYNRAQWIGQAIQSALDQDYPNFEIIISDNNSTDNTDDVIRTFCSDPRIKYYKNETNIGMVANFKKATYELISGEYLTYISSDDYLCNRQFLSNSVNLINKYPNIVLVAAKNCMLLNDTDTNQIVDDPTDHVFANEFMEGKDVFNNFAKWFAPGWGGVLMVKNKLLDSQAFDSIAQSVDYEANLKLMLQGNVAFIKKTSYVFRKHSLQVSGYMTHEAYKNNLELIDNVYFFAKKLDNDINLELWRKKITLTYLNSVTRKLISNKNEIEKIVNHVEKVKKIKVTLFKNPILFIKIIAYKNYTLFSPLVRFFKPSAYLSIKKEIG